MRKTLPVVAVCAAALCCGLPASANDTMAELKTGGLVFVRSDVVVMEEEDLYISQDEVRVSYVFRNMSDGDVDSLVAFPMPEITGSPWSDVAVPDSQSDNLLGFEVEVGGRAVAPQLEQKAFAIGLDVTSALVAARVPFNPFSEAAFDAVQLLPEATRRDWVARGIVSAESWDEGSGMREYYTPVWSMRSTYWWRMTFPAGQAVSVSHRYRPSVGGTVGVTFLELESGRARGPDYERYRTKYCLDDGFVRAVERHAAQDPDRIAPFYENWISYVLTTGANWAGPIGRFRLTVDKGAAGNLVSFCGSNVRKTGPTTFEMVASDFHPDHDLDILLLKRVEFARDADPGDEAASDEPRERKALKSP